MSTVERAVASGGHSGPGVYGMVARVLEERGIRGGRLLDVGCGQGALAAHVLAHVDAYEGADVVRHPGFPAAYPLHLRDMDAGRLPLADGSFDVVACVETIEHVENPRALVRELVRLVRPGGLVLVTTPNQLSLLSLLCLWRFGQFDAFRDGSYPAHITALVPQDLMRIGREVGLEDLRLTYSDSGRVPFSGRRYPRGFRGARFSDNVAVSGLRSA
ncbi:MAG: methyltransferase domain-containing protein [Myxococcota bacterium]